MGRGLHDFAVNHRLGNRGYSDDYVRPARHGHDSYQFFRRPNPSPAHALPRQRPDLAAVGHEHSLSGHHGTRISSSAPSRANWSSGMGTRWATVSAKPLSPCRSAGSEATAGAVALPHRPVARRPTSLSIRGFRSVTRGPGFPLPSPRRSPNGIRTQRSMPCRVFYGRPAPSAGWRSLRPARVAAQDFNELGDDLEHAAPHGATHPPLPISLSPCRQPAERVSICSGRRGQRPGGAVTPGRCPRAAARRRHSSGRPPRC